MNDCLSHDQVVELFRSLGRIEQRLEDNTETLRAHTEEDRQRFEIIDDRLRFVEKVAAVGAAAATVASILIGYFM